MAPGVVSDETATAEITVEEGKIIPTIHINDNNKSEDEFSSANEPAASQAQGEDGKIKSDSEEAAESATAPEGQIMKCQFKHLDRRYDDQDELYFAERKSELEKPRQKDWWRMFAFCMVRQYNKENTLSNTRLYVNSPSLRQLLFDVIGDYPSDPIDIEDVQIESPFRSLFHYREELETEGLKRFADDEESSAQLKLLISWIKSHFELDLAAYNRCIKGDLKAISYDRLWTLFRPGTIVYSKVLQHDRAFRVARIWYDDGELPGLNVRVGYVDFDGEKLGERRMTLFIPQYAGTQELSGLSTMPLDLVWNVEEMREALTTRGRKFESYVGQHFAQYDGVALKRKDMCYARYNVTGRVMVDCKTFHRLEPNDTFNLRDLGDVESIRRNKGRKKAFGYANFASETVETDKLSDEDVMLANATVRGYSFTTKRFLEFFIDQLSPIDWNTKCFDDLVLDESIKKTVQAIVSTRSSKRESFDDIVKGKGRGLVCVLHGPPGVGKTLTAECVAEYVQRPLYMVSSGDLGVTSADLDTQLTRIMDMTSTWGAVLLIDEADVFLEQRSLHDLHRNAMVSVFLRVLEYYSGILFLTTNRVNTFDDAFKSRIHIPLRYTDLTVESRAQIWRNFCRMVPGGVDVDERGFALLAEHELNGRQIKNIVRAAESLASFDGVKLDLKQLQQVTKIQATFEKDLNSLSGIDYTAPGASKKNAESRHMFL
ncbi:P-loop containing nucleoside triphosphate hydrolase protein [Xylariales sp. PMI_506]|nr:P-loop containing nucleoside triphosphate hydrolase protein [Xylariales sp. PMI_506]